MNDDYLFFVYGLLMSGGPGFLALGLQSRTRRLGPACVTGRLHHLGDYPGLIIGGRGVVHGELLAFGDPHLVDELDAYELFDPENPAGSEYLRVEVNLLGDDRPAWTYEYNRPVKDRPIIATGNWRTR